VSLFADVPIALLVAGLVLHWQHRDYFAFLLYAVAGYTVISAAVFYCELVGFDSVVVEEGFEEGPEEEYIE
jgi:hypothetical protein